MNSKFQKYRLALAALSIAGPLWAGSEPPLLDSMRISAAVLLKAEPARPSELTGEWQKWPSKKLPLSASLYLKPSNVIDSRSEKVKKAARQALALLGRGAAKPALEDPRILADAARGWTELYLTAPDDHAQARFYAMDSRLRIPKASAIIGLGQADHEGRVRVRAALLRAMGVPARIVSLRGEAELEYFAALHSDAPTKLKGMWVLDATQFGGEPVEATALDPGDLAFALWKPEQELGKEAVIERAYYSLSDTAKAMADLDYVKAYGRLPLSASTRVLPPRKGSWLLLANHRARFSTEGGMEALSALDLLLPYRPRLASWGSEARPVPDSLDTVATASFSDRPSRLRNFKKGDWVDEYKSPPPAYGVLHYATFSTRKPQSVLDAKLVGGTLKGKLLRRDSLAPSAGWDVTVALSGTAKPLPDKKASTDATGEFSIELSPEELKARFLTVAGGQGSVDNTRWDSMLIEIGEPR